MSVNSKLSSTEARIEKFKFLVEQNPLAQQRIGQEFIEAKGDLSAMAAEKKTLEGQLGELLDKAAKLNRDEVTIGQLTKAAELQKESFTQYKKLYEQTRIEEALDNSRFTNVRVVQEPSFVPKAVSPKKSLIAAAGLVAATTGAILIALFLELFWTGRPRNEDSLETEILENNEFLTEPSIANG